MFHTSFFSFAFTAFVCILCISNAHGQFIDEFDRQDHKQKGSWSTATGSGNVMMNITHNDGYATITVDATNDERNVWWAVIKREVGTELNLKKAAKSNYELRIEAKIKVSHAPRRVNLHLNTQRTTDFHSHLMEFDIPDTTNWHKISFTTDNFDVRPTDQVNAQMALMDWGLEKYKVYIDQFKVDVVDINHPNPTSGTAVPYHPPIPELHTFEHSLPVTDDSMIDAAFPDMNFNNWVTFKNGDTVNLLSINATQRILLKWDFKPLNDLKIKGAGLLVLTTQNLQTHDRAIKDFGMLRVVEIMNGPENWNEEEITYNSLIGDYKINEVLNPQMIIDVKVASGNGHKNFITIPNPVLQRLVNGKSRGIAIQALGAINASFYAKENPNQESFPILYLNTESKTTGQSQ